MGFDHMLIATVDISGEIRARRGSIVGRTNREGEGAAVVFERTRVEPWVDAPPAPPRYTRRMRGMWECRKLRRYRRTAR